LEQAVPGKPERCLMPWAPELFSAPVLERFLEEHRRVRLEGVPFFDGLMTGEIDALIGSFAGEPEVHHPVRGRVKGASAFARFVTDTTTWMTERNITFEAVNFIVTPSGGVEEFVLHLDGDAGRIELPLALAADLDQDARMIELRMYFSSWPMTGVHRVRPPLLQPDPDLHESDVVGDYQRALAAGDVDAAVAAFEPDGYVREPAGGAYTHRGTDELRALYELFFSNGGGIALEHCVVIDDGRACALEYNVVAWGRTELPPEAGIAVYVRGDSGKLAAARIYDDTDPPLSGHG
jgi:SnoaL-like domain